MARCAHTEPILQQALSEVKVAAKATRGDYAGDLPEAVRNYILRAFFWAVFEVDLGQKSSSEYKAAVWSSSALNAVVKQYMLGITSAVKQPELLTLQHLIMCCPPLKDYKVDASLPEGPDKVRFVAQVMPVVFIAALQGIPTLARALLIDKSSLSDAAGSDSAWRKGLPKGFMLPRDREKMRLVVLETCRLNPPVPETVAVLTQRETFEISGVGKRSFPAGTPLLLSYSNTALNEKNYKNATAFDPYGHASSLWGPESIFNGFNGVGDKGDRLCPGRDLSIELLINLLEAVHSATPSSANSFA